MRHKLVFLILWAALLLNLFFSRGWAFELNYRLLERRDIQNYLHQQFVFIEKNFFNLIGQLTPSLQFGEENELIQSYYVFHQSLPEFREQCVNPLAAPRKNFSGLGPCPLAIEKVIRAIRALDESLQNLLLLNPFFTLNTPIPKHFFDYQLSPMAMNLNFDLATSLHRYELFLTEMNYMADLDPEKTRWVGLEQFNGLKSLTKQIQTTILAGAIPSYLREDFTLFWQQFIDVMIEKSSPQEKREYWMINLFQLNLRLNEFFYACERQKQKMPKNAYSICEDIHTTWNQTLKSTLKFHK